MQHICNHLFELKAQGLFRQLHLPQGIDVSSNDVLGLSHHPQVRQDLIHSLKKGVPMGAGGSRLLRGHHKQHEGVEEFIADKFQCESALVYGSGYLANMGVITALFKDFHIFSDEWNHASIVDGIRLSGARKSIYRHCDIADLKENIFRSEAKNKVIVSESLFSMSGELAPVDLLWELAQECRAWLMIDEAHATGIYGKRGLGFVDDLGCRKNIVSVHTMGKAFGAQGAFVLCCRVVRDELVNTSRSFIYTTSPSPLLMEQWKSVWRIWEREQMQHKLLKQVSWFHKQASCSSSLKSHIIPIVVPGNKRVIEVAKRLQENNFDVRGIRYPTVPKGQERLRICLNIHQTRPQLEKMLHLVSDL